MTRTAMPAAVPAAGLPGTDHDGVARTQLLDRAAWIGVLMRHSVNIIVAVVLLGTPEPASGPGKLVMGALAGYSLYRLCTRCAAPAWTMVDYLSILGVCLATPALVAGAQFYTANSAPVAIAGTAVISFAVAEPARVSLPMTAGIAVAFAFGSAWQVGWDRVPEIFNLYYFALQWATAAAIRAMIVRVAETVDRACTRREARERHDHVAAAVREYEREQLRLLHDTVASTLLMVGSGAAPPSDRLAAQARRDLTIVAGHHLNHAPDPHADLTQAIEDAAAHSATPVTIHRDQTSPQLDRVPIAAIAAATREAITNVDRHAHADHITITIGSGQVRIADDGTGFDTAAPQTGHGIAQSIHARMRSAGGSATVTSRRGAGTTVALQWDDDTRPDEQPTSSDPDRLIGRTRTIFGLALTGYGLANLAVMVAAAPSSAHNTPQLALAALMAATTGLAVPAILGRSRMPAWPAAATLIGAALVQTTLTASAELGSGAQWSQASVGWCLLPWLLRQRLHSGVGLLIASWVAPAAYTVARDPTMATIVNTGLGTASILSIQLFALLFNDLIVAAARSARHQSAATAALRLREGIAHALHQEYRCRFADLAADITPLLEQLCDCTRISARQRRRANTHYQRLRALFDQSRSFEHTALQYLRRVVDAAQARGQTVTIHIAGPLPELSSTAAQQLSRHVAQTLEATTADARIALTTTPTELEISVVLTNVPLSQRQRLTDLDNHQRQITTSADTVWATISHTTTTEGAIDELISAAHR